MIDNKTTNLQIPLPNAANTLAEDVDRLVQAFVVIDSQVSAKADSAAMTSALAAKADSADVETALAEKQDALVSGDNIKTINGASLLGAGNIDTAGVSSLNGLVGDLAGFVTETGAQTLTNKTLTSPVINGGTASGLTLNDGYTEEVFAVTGTTPALSPTNGSIQTWALTGNSTPTQGTWANGQSITLMIDDGTANTITWTSLAVNWKTDAGASPTLNTTGFTVIALWKVGNVIYGARVGDA